MFDYSTSSLYPLVPSPIVITQSLSVTNLPILCYNNPMSVLQLERSNLCDNSHSNITRGMFGVYEPKILTILLSITKPKIIKEVLTKPKIIKEVLSNSD